MLAERDAETETDYRRKWQALLPFALESHSIRGST